MKRIAVLACRSAENVCAGVGCLRAFSRRTGAFAAYGEEELELIAFMHCNGCWMPQKHAPYDQRRFTPLAEDPGLMEKVERLEKEQVDVVHLGICCRNQQGECCPAMEELSRELQRRGMQVVQGTHGTR